MRQPNATRAAGRSQRGYALMLVLFVLALLALATIAATPNTVTQGQREKEEEMVWRGKQYVRGIRLFYQKNHRFPTQLEDLYQPKTGIRFMRQAYKDPMNNADGSWRLIYVGPNGQLIGSLKPHTLGANGQAGQTAATGFGSPAGQNNQSSFGNSSFGNSSFGGSSSGSSSFGGSSNGSSSPNGSSSFGSGFGSNANSGSGNTTPDPNDPNAQNSGSGDMSTPQSLAPSESSGSPSIIGGNIIGVGSKISKRSFLWYEKAKNYRLFEFIWDPSVDSQTGRSLGVPPPNASPFGTQTPLSTGSPFSSGTPNTGSPGTMPTQSTPAPQQ